LYEAIELLKDIKRQNSTIIKRLASIDEINAEAHGYVLREGDEE
jgi:hypothetical protein